MNEFKSIIVINYLQLYICLQINHYFTPSEFFAPALADGLSLVFEW